MEVTKDIAMLAKKQNTLLSSEGFQGLEKHAMIVLPGRKKKMFKRFIKKIIAHFKFIRELNKDCECDYCRIKGKK